MTTPLAALAIASPLLYWAWHTRHDTYDCHNGCHRRPRHLLHRYATGTGRTWQCPDCGTRWHTTLRTRGYQTPDTYEWRRTRP